MQYKALLIMDHMFSSTQYDSDLCDFILLMSPVVSVVMTEHMNNCDAMLVGVLQIHKLCTVLPCLNWIYPTHKTQLCCFKLDCIYDVMYIKHPSHKAYGMLNATVCNESSPTVNCNMRRIELQIGNKIRLKLGQIDLSTQKAPQI